MHVSIPVPTLIEILAVIIVLGILLRLVFMRRQLRSGKAPRVRRSPRRGPAKSPGRRPFQIKRTRSGRRDHGWEVAHKHGRERSPEWPRVEQEHLLHEPACVACGYRGQGLQVHHIKPFHLYPELELDPRNLITLCEVKGRDHHLLLGHLDDWESYNPKVRTDVQRFHKENARQIRANPAWIEEMQHRPQPRS